MIKGINRQIIEVEETGSLYFEKALLFVRHQLSNTDERYLKREAKRMINDFSKPPRLNLQQKRRKRNRTVRKIGNALFWSTLGASVFALVQQLFI